MEALSNVSVFATAVVAFIGAYIVYWLRQRREHFSCFTKLGIPGPTPSLLWGNIWKIYWNGNLGAQTEWHAKYGPIIGYFFGYQPVLLISDSGKLKQILLKDFTDFVDRGTLFGGQAGGLEHGLTELKGQRWKHVRSTLTPSFTSSKLKQLSPEVGHIVDDFILNLDSQYAMKKEVDIYEEYQALTLDTICRSALGVDFGIQKDVANSRILKQVKIMFSTRLNWTSVILVCFPLLRTIVGPIVRTLRMRAMNDGEDPSKALKAQCKSVVKHRRSDPTSRRVDLLQLMIDAQGEASNFNSLIAGDDAEKHVAKGTNGGAPSSQCPMGGTNKGLTDDEIIDNAFLVLLAGYETTSSSLAFITRMLLRFPDVQEALRQELLKVTDNGTVFDFERLQRCHYLEAVIQETLRMYPPIYSFTSRTALTDKLFDGVKVPKGMSVFASTAALHYDEEIFPNAKEFQPDRFLPDNKTSAMAWAWQPFGAGPRNCIGMRFAQMEIKIALAKLLTKYRIHSEREPKGDTHIDVVVQPALQRIKDPLLCKLERFNIETAV